MRKRNVVKYRSEIVKVNGMLSFSRLILLLLLMTFQQLIVYGNTQDKIFSFNRNSITLRELIQEIESESEFTFFYNEARINLDMIVSGNLKKKSVVDVLDNALDETNITFEVVGKQIILSNKDLGNTQQKIKVTGKIISAANGYPVPGVNVVEKGTTNGTITDLDGKYIITVSSENAILLFTCIGFLSEEQLVGKNKVMNLTLVEDIQALEEIVVVGYGTQKKSVVTGSITTISNDELTKTSSTNLTNALAGRVSGVISGNESGTPGSGSKLNIRGISTYNNSQPLIIIDGVEDNSFGQLDPNEIESMSILKDAAAGAVYGARAANGVILITTKRGKKGDPQFNYNGSYNISQPTRYPELLNAHEYGTIRNQGALNMGFDPDNPAQQSYFFTYDELERFRTGQVGTNWYDETFKDFAEIHRHNLNVRGGTDKLGYFFSGGFVDEGAMYENLNFRRYNLRSNVDASITDNFKISVDLSARNENRDQNAVGLNSYKTGEGHLFTMVGRVAPIYNAYDSLGRPLDPSARHPVEESKNTGLDQRTINTFRGTFKATKNFQFVDGLSSTFLYSYNQKYQTDKSFIHPYTLYTLDANGDPDGDSKEVGIDQATAGEKMNKSNSYTMNVGVNYDKKIGDHQINILALYEQSESYGSNFYAERIGYISYSIPELFAGGDEDKNNDGSAWEVGRVSLLSRISYAYASKYLFETSIRRDGSSRFPKEDNNRWGLFPSVSVGWRISEESFFKSNISAINNLKVRASFGLLGNDRQGNPKKLYQYQTTYRYSEGAVFDGLVTPGITKSVEPNPDITWEKSRTLNFGIEAGLFDNILQFELDYFNKLTSDILAPKVISTPETFGASLPDVNYAEVENSGFDFSMNYRNQVGKVRYSVKGNVTYAKNIVKKIDDPDNLPIHLRREGQPLDFYTGHKTDGLFQSDEDVMEWYPQFNNNRVGSGDIKYVDRDNNDTIDDRDLDVISNFSYLPELMFGLNLSVEWNNIDLNILFQGAANRTIMYAGQARNMYVIGGSNNTFSYMKDYWSVENPGAQYPRAWIDANDNNDRDSDYWLINGNYLRLKTIEIGYTFKKELLYRFKIDNLRVFASAANLFSFDHIKDFDPEIGKSSAAGYAINSREQRNYTVNGAYYPQKRTISLGVNLTF